jgi:hypothetical protein
MLQLKVYVHIHRTALQDTDSNKHKHFQVWKHADMRTKPRTEAITTPVCGSQFAIFELKLEVYLLLRTSAINGNFI